MNESVKVHSLVSEAYRLIEDVETADEVVEVNAAIFDKLNEIEKLIF